MLDRYGTSAKKSTCSTKADGTSMSRIMEPRAAGVRKRPALTNNWFGIASTPINRARSHVFVGSSNSVNVKLWPGSRKSAIGDTITVIMA